MTTPEITHPAWCVEDRFTAGIGAGNSHLSAEIVLPQTRNTHLTVRLAQASVLHEHRHPDETLDPQILIAGVSDREGVWLRLDLDSAQELLSALPALMFAAVHPDFGVRRLTAVANVTAERNTLDDVIPAAVPPVLDPELDRMVVGDQILGAAALPAVRRQCMCEQPGVPCTVHPETVVDPGEDGPIGDSVLDPDVAFDEAKDADRVGFFSGPDGAYRFTNPAGHGSKIMVSSVCTVFVATWPGPIADAYRLIESTKSRPLRRFDRLDEARAYFVQLRDALPVCGFDIDDAVAALAVMTEVADTCQIKPRVSATCCWDMFADPHVADYMTVVGAVCVDCAICHIKLGGRHVSGLPPLPEIHALKLIRTAEKAALAAAAS